MRKGSKLRQILILVVSLLSACGYAEWPPSNYSPELGDVNSPALEVGVKRSGMNITVGRGDTIFSISRRYKVPMREIINVNKLSPPFSLELGQVIHIPNSGKAYVVKRGDTLFSISRRHNMDQYLIARLNGIRPPYIIYENQKITLLNNSNIKESEEKKIYISEGHSLKTSVQNKKTVLRKKNKPSGVHNDKARRKVQKKVKKTKHKHTSLGGVLENDIKFDKKKKPSFIWPIKGNVVSSFGVKSKGLRNDGINIGADRGTPVLASERGIVVYAGNELRGFGKLLLIKHPGGWLTAYAHNEELLVKRGEILRRGQKIATVGSTGNVSSPQLHFEIRFGKIAKDPRRFIKLRLS